MATYWLISIIKCWPSKFCWCSCSCCLSSIAHTKSILVNSKTVKIDRAKGSAIILSIIQNKNFSNQKVRSIFRINCFKFGIEMTSKACGIAEPCCLCFCRRNYLCTRGFPSLCFGICTFSGQINVNRYGNRKQKKYGANLWATESKITPFESPRIVYSNKGAALGMVTTQRKQ